MRCHSTHQKCIYLKRRCSLFCFKSGKTLTAFKSKSVHRRRGRNGRLQRIYVCVCVWVNAQRNWYVFTKIIARSDARSRIVCFSWKILLLRAREGTQCLSRAPRPCILRSLASTSTSSIFAINIPSIDRKHLTTTRPFLLFWARSKYIYCIFNFTFNSLY